MSEIKMIGAMDNTVDHTFESANRVYSDEGIAPTISTFCGGGQQPKVMEVKKIIYDDYNSRVRADQSTMGTLTTNVGSGTLRNGVKIIEQTSVKVKQATHQGYIECELGGGGKLELPQLSNPPRASNRERKDLPDSDNGEYP